jgi:WD40 repeat protein
MSAPGRLARLATTGEVFGIAFSPDGRTLASGDADGNVILWDGAKRIGAFASTAAQVGAVAFSPDGRTLAAAHANGTIALWDVGEHALLATLFATAPGATSMAFSPDGRDLAIGMRSGRLIVQPLQPSAWRRHLCSIVGRDFTAVEWRQFAPHSKQRPVCA